MSIKIMSFNIQHCENFNTKEIDFDIFADTISKSGADIIGLNEVRGNGTRNDYEAQAQILAEKTGYNYYFAKAIDVDGTNPYGNAILSKYPVISAETLPIPDPSTKSGKEHYETRCVLETEIQTEKPLTVLVTHFGLNRDEQINAVNTILPLIKSERCILMGDFNLTPDSEIINPIKNKMKDTAAYFKNAMLSFPSDFPKIKIDYIFVSPDLNVIDATIPALVVSDHRPHTAVINF